MGLRRLAISNPSANTDTVLFTADDQYLMSVIAANKSTTSASNIRVWIEPAGSSGVSEYAFIVYDIPVDETNSYETFRFAVNQGDVIKIRANSANISFQATGLVQFDVNLGVGITSYVPVAPTNPVNGMIWVDADMTGMGGNKPAYVYSADAESWIPIVGGIDTAASYTFSGNNQFSGTNTFTGTVTIPGYEKTIPLQATAPTTPSSGDLWIDNSAGTPQLKVYNGSVWTALGAAVDDKSLVLAQRMFMQ